MIYRGGLVNKGGGKLPGELALRCFYVDWWAPKIRRLLSKTTKYSTTREPGYFSKKKANQPPNK
jgi:hypothetical protein